MGFSAHRKEQAAHGGPFPENLEAREARVCIHANYPQRSYICFHEHGKQCTTLDAMAPGIRVDPVPSALD